MTSFESCQSPCTELRNSVQSEISARVVNFREKANLKYIMGNKISLGSIVIYCGFPKKRRKTKKREEEKRREIAAQEEFESYQRAEKFCRDNPDYIREARLAALRCDFNSWTWFIQKEKEGCHIKKTKGPTSKEIDELLFTGMPATDRTYDVGICIRIKYINIKYLNVKWRTTMSVDQDISRVRKAKE